MVIMRDGGKSSDMGGDGPRCLGISKPDAYDINNVEVLRFLLEAFPSTFNTVRDEFISVMDECFRMLRDELEDSRAWAHEVTIMKLMFVGLLGSWEIGRIS